MTVVGKFFVSEIVRHDGAPTADRVKLGAVCRGRENRQWASATPWGTIEMGILNDAATEQFEQGAEYLVTFQKVPKPAPHDGHEPIPAPGFGHVTVEEAQYVMCEFCGVNAKKDPDTGALDWSDHEKAFGPE
jgi:hypothetical protein